MPEYYNIDLEQYNIARQQALLLPSAAAVSADRLYNTGSTSGK